jgi:hypothetical protein
MRIAFKEWAVVCRALASGRQIVILRKGGIIEEGGAFRPDHPETVIPEARVSFEELEREMPETGNVVFRHCATVTDVIRVESLKSVHALRGTHVWSDDVVEERFHRWRDHSVWAMIVRVSALAKPMSVALREEYTGCKSWVHLEEDVSAESAVAVVDEREYTLRRQTVKVTLLKIMP